jgi:hypothetical protein
VLLRDPLDGRRKRAEIVDVLSIAEDCAGKRLGLRPSLAVVGVVEEVADDVGA